MKLFISLLLLGIITGSAQANALFTYLESSSGGRYVQFDASIYNKELGRKGGGQTDLVLGASALNPFGLSLPLAQGECLVSSESKRRDEHSDYDTALVSISVGTEAKNSIQSSATSIAPNISADFYVDEDSSNEYRALQVVKSNHSHRGMALDIIESECGEKAFASSLHFKLKRNLVEVVESFRCAPFVLLGYPVAISQYEIRTTCHLN